jgi:hypothetical protein
LFRINRYRTTRHTGPSVEDVSTFRNVIVGAPNAPEESFKTIEVDGSYGYAQHQRVMSEDWQGNAMKQSADSTVVLASQSNQRGNL